MALLGVLTDPNAEPIERDTMRRVTRRLIPLLMICYFVGYLDRVNVSFAALTMNEDLHFSAAVYGFGGGVFFLGYFLFEIPSNLLLARFGARKWIARILITWGIISALTAAVWNEASFYGIRFVLGLAEAGFFPGIILYLTWWFPSYYRSRITGMFMTAIPISVVLGSIISGWIISVTHGWGMAGWQWLFVLEGVPAAILGVIVLFYLTDTPDLAHWLTPAQRTWLNERLASERAQRETVHHYALGETLLNGRVWALTLVYFGQNVAGYGLVIFLPQIIKRFGVSDVQTGFINAIPFACAAVAMVLWGLHSDRTGERTKHTAAACFLTFIGLAACLGIDNPYLLMTAIVLAQMGQSSIAPTFWALPTAMLSGTAAAGGIALINAVGNLGGFIGPYAMGLIRDSTGNFKLGLFAISCGALVAGIVVLALGHDRGLERIGAAKVAE
jgi:ACS family tartrate transporter-like MFS transporter